MSWIAPLPLSMPSPIKSATSKKSPWASGRASRKAFFPLPMRLPPCLMELTLRASAKKQGDFVSTWIELFKQNDVGEMIRLQLVVGWQKAVDGTMGGIERLSNMMVKAFGAPLIYFRATVQKNHRRSVGACRQNPETQFHPRPPRLQANSFGAVLNDQTDLALMSAKHGPSFKVYGDTAEQKQLAALWQKASVSVASAQKEIETKAAAVKPMGESVPTVQETTGGKLDRTRKPSPIPFPASASTSAETRFKNSLLTSSRKQRDIPFPHRRQHRQPRQKHLNGPRLWLIIPSEDTATPAPKNNPNPERKITSFAVLKPPAFGVGTCHRNSKPSCPLLDSSADGDVVSSTLSRKRGTVANSPSNTSNRPKIQGFVKLPFQQNPRIEITFNQIEKSIESHPTKGPHEFRWNYPQLMKKLGNSKPGDKPRHPKTTIPNPKTGTSDPKLDNDADWESLADDVKKIAAKNLAGMENYIPCLSPLFAELAFP